MRLSSLWPFWKIITSCFNPLGWLSKFSSMCYIVSVLVIASSPILQICYHSHAIHPHLHKFDIFMPYYQFSFQLIIIILLHRLKSSLLILQWGERDYDLYISIIWIWRASKHLGKHSYTFIVHTKNYLLECYSKNIS